MSKENEYLAKDKYEQSFSLEVMRFVGISYKIKTTEEELVKLKKALKVAHNAVICEGYPDAEIK